MHVRRLFIAHLLLLIGLVGTGCSSKAKPSISEELTIGVVSYGEGQVSLDQYNRLREHIAQETNTIVELEPAYNEQQAIEQIQQKDWSIVFAPPGLAALAISEELYIPIFTLEGLGNRQRALIIVRNDNPIESLTELANQVVALGQPGSATGYYLPLYDLYGLTLAEVRFAPTPKTILEWISDETVVAGALSEEEFEQYKRDFDSTKFRILHTSRWLPTGAVLLGPTVERNRQSQIEQVMRDAPSDIASDAGYVPNARIPDYQLFIEIVQKVKPLEDRIRQKPAVLTIEENNTTNKLSEETNN